MLDYRSIIPLSLLCLYISSCTNDTNSSVLELNSPTSTRMDAAISNGFEYQVDITINSGAVQSFSVDPTETTVPVIIAGVRANEQNTIEILWKGIVDDVSVELSRQSQVFLADSNTIIDAPHNTEEFDFDADGASNLFELTSGSCIWSNTNTVPCSFPVSTNNIFVNADFSNVNDQWWSRGQGKVDTGGEYCVGSPAAAILPSNSQIGYRDRFRLEKNSSYTLSFDARAEQASTIVATVSLPDFNFEVVAERRVELFSTYREYNYSFETANRDYGMSSFVFNLGTGMENYYCFDNVVLEQVIE